MQAMCIPGLSHCGSITRTKEEVAATMTSRTFHAGFYRVHQFDVFVLGSECGTAFRLG
jgi:hypothetical protein